MGHSPIFADAPVRVYWEITRACDLACAHCRAEAAPEADPRELDTQTGLRLIRQLAQAGTAESAGRPAMGGGSPGGRPHIIFTGGDPLKRADLWELIAYARGLGMHVSVSPSATPLLTADAIGRLHDAGVAAISLSIDGATAERHDAIRGVPGTFQRTMIAAERAHEVGLPFQVNTLVAKETLEDLPAIETLCRGLKADRWSLFFLVTVGRGTVLEAITAEESESLLGWLAERAKVPGMVITTTEAPHFRRVVMEHREHGAPTPKGHGAGMRDGNGVMFISSDGEISPSGFLPIAVGNVKTENPLTVYREGFLFKALRDADQFHGRCGVCEYRMVCGGSRARAYAATMDPLAEDPLCVYEPHRHAEPRA